MHSGIKKAMGDGKATKKKSWNFKLKTVKTFFSISSVSQVVLKPWNMAELDYVWMSKKLIGWSTR